MKHEVGFQNSIILVIFAHLNSMFYFVTQQDILLLTMTVVQGLHFFH